MNPKNIYAEILTIGDEILYGQITDTNSQWISGELDKIGIRIRRKSSVGDNEQEILDILAEAENRAEIILITGGLGPTNDDITKRTLCTYFKCGLILNEEVLNYLTEFFSRRGRELTKLNRDQALLPEACQLIPNRWGTAPAMWFEKDGKILISMPGVPFEMKSIMTEEVIPRLIHAFKTPFIYHKIIKTVGIGESFLAEKIKPWEDALPSHIRLAYLPSFAEVRLRLTATGVNKNLIIEETDKEAGKLQDIINDYIYGYDNDTLEAVTGKILKQNGKNLSVAESCTGGYVSHLLTSIPGSSEYFKGSVVAYDNDIKSGLLGVSEEGLGKYGAVSEETVKEMAEGIRKKFTTYCSIAITGIAGPGGGTDDKPVGTVWIAYSDASGTVAKKLTLGSLRDVNIKLSSVFVLNLLRLSLLRSLPK